MIEDRTAQRKKLREELAEIKNDAITQLERLGYNVRGKTPAQIRQILKRRPMKPNLGRIE
jgi:F0F1-type ATP synthase membrane subunit b/b'